MNAQALLAHILQMIDLTKRMLLSLEGADGIERIAKFFDSEVSIILQNACLQS
jgi:hypothetical protein